MTCRHRIRALLAPSARAAWTYSNSRAPEDLSAHQSRVTDPADDGQGKQDVGQARSEHCDKRDREQQPRKRQGHVGNAADAVVDEPTKVAGHRPEQRPDAG
jgi:hypothetical protein